MSPETQTSNALVIDQKAVDQATVDAEKTQRLAGVIEKKQKGIDNLKAESQDFGPAVETVINFRSNVASFCREMGVLNAEQLAANNNVPDFRLLYRSRDEFLSAVLLELGVLYVPAKGAKRADKPLGKLTPTDVMNDIRTLDAYQGEKYKDGTAKKKAESVKEIKASRDSAIKEAENLRLQVAGAEEREAQHLAEIIKERDAALAKLAEYESQMARKDAIILEQQTRIQQLEAKLATTKSKAK